MILLDFIFNIINIKNLVGDVCILIDFGIKLGIYVILW